VVVVKAAVAADTAVAVMAAVVDAAVQAADAVRVVAMATFLNASKATWSKK
jgi:hypothetical protein